MLIATATHSIFVPCTWCGRALLIPKTQSSLTRPQGNCGLF